MCPIILGHGLTASTPLYSINRGFEQILKGFLGELLKDFKSIGAKLEDSMSRRWSNLFGSTLQVLRATNSLCKDIVEVCTLL